MEVTYAKACQVYVTTKSPVPGDQEIPLCISFSSLEELSPGYIMTPLDGLFKHCMERLELPFQGASVDLTRSGSFPRFFSPPHLTFRAYNYNKKNLEDTVPNVVYTRILNDAVPYRFDGLERREFTLDDVEKMTLEKAPAGGDVRIVLRDAEISLRTGFDPVATLAHSMLNDSYAYKRTQKLSVKPIVSSWMVFDATIKDLGKVSVEDAVKEVEETLERYLEAEQQGGRMFGNEPPSF